MNRKPISKKIRFEIFKRDKFTCQYCGQKAPDVILEIDHVHPVSKGGKNELLNLVTSCEGCNRGKSDRELSDDSIVKINRDQIESLQERRDQIEMMIEWQRGLDGSHKDAEKKASGYWTEITRTELTPEASATVRTLIKKHGLSLVLSEMRSAVDEFVYPGQSEKDHHDSCEYAFKKFQKIIRYGGDDLQKKTAYIMGILKNRTFIDRDEMGIVGDKIKDATKYGVTIEDIISRAKWVDSVSEFMSYLDSEILNSVGAKGQK